MFFKMSCKEKSPIQTTSKTEFKLPILSFPKKIIVEILDKLELEDIKSCRRVCKELFSCCESSSITKRESYCFYAGIYTATEVNELLENTMRSSFNLFLWGFNVNELRFSKFGGKIATLYFSICYFNEIESVINIFLHTPEMRTITFFNCFSPRKGFVRAVLLATQEQSLQFQNVKEFALTGDIEVKCSEDIIPYERFFQIFPNLVSFEGRGADLNGMILRNQLLKCNLHTLRGTRRHVDSPFNGNVMLMPKFKELEITVSSHTGEFSTYDNFCRDLFTYQSELETITLDHDCQFLRCNHAENKKFKDFLINLICYILQTCTKLQTMDFSHFCNLVGLNPPNQDIILFLANFKPILRGISVRMTAHPYEIHTSTLALMERVKLLNLEYLNADNSSVFTFGNLYSTLSLLLNSLKFLRTLRLSINADKLNISRIDSAVDESSQKVYSKSLDHLNIDIFNPMEPINAELNDVMSNIWIKTYNSYQFFKMCEFPNLRELHLWKHPALSEYVQKAEILDWIIEIPSLTTLTLLWFPMTMDDTMKIISNMPRLMIFEFETEAEKLSEDEIKNIFRSSESLQFIDMSPTGNVIRVCRSKKMLYLCEDSLSFYTPFASLYE